MLPRLDTWGANAKENNPRRQEEKVTALVSIAEVVPDAKSGCEGAKRNGGKVTKTIHCKRIKPGQTEECGKPRKVKKMAHRTKWCVECAHELQREMSRNNYRKKPFEPYAKTCRCGAEILIEKSTGNRKTKCKPCAIFDRKNWHKTEEYIKPDTKSLAKRTKCRCGKCGKIHHEKLHLHESERKKVDAGRPHRKRCHRCDLAAGRLECCDISDGHGVGVM